MLAGDQSIRAFPELKGSKSNLNLSSDVNTVASNSALEANLNLNNTPFDEVLSSNGSYVDKTLVAKLGSLRSLNTSGMPPVLSANSENSNSLEYDSLASSTELSKKTSQGGIEVLRDVTKGAVGEVFVGSREKTPRAINTSY